MINKYTKNKAGFDDRIVNYAYIHGNQEIDFQNLLLTVNAKESDVILDGCGGYMDVSERILKTFQENKPMIFVLDESSVQLNRAKEKNILPGQNLIQGDISNIPFPDETFDKVIVKMGMHEIPLERQRVAFQECYRVLKSGGKLIIWELSLPDKETQKLFQDIIREKDRLCGFDYLVENRWFQTHDELLELFDQANFISIKDEFPINSYLSTDRRLSEFVSKDRLEIIKTKGKIEEDDEILLNKVAYEKLGVLCDYFRKVFPEHLKEKLKYNDTGDNVVFEVDKIIMSGIKK